MGLPRLSTIFAAAPAVLVMLMTLEARAANNAYAVDAADISEVGSCKVESWISSASNTDFSAVANPSCVVDLFKPCRRLIRRVDRRKSHRVCGGAGDVPAVRN